MIKLDNKVHIVRDLQTNTLAINFWNDCINKFDDIKVFLNSSILKKKIKFYNYI